jgi:6-phosphogluconolactonase/glucosamine-6-phosphate isomerase/deaminase
MEITSEHNRDHLRHKASAHLNLLLKEYNTVPILLMLSGGSAFNLLHDIHPEHIDDRVTIAMLDERYSRDHAINNFSQMTHLPFYKLAHMRGAAFVNTRLEDDKSIEYFARDYESKVRKWDFENRMAGGVVIATMGIGTDGHVAGIMPYQDDHATFTRLFDDQNKWIVGYDAKEKNEHRHRVTTTLPFLRKIDHTICFVAGENKKDALHKALAQDGSLFETPARIVHEMKNLQIFTTLPL